MECIFKGQRKGWSEVVQQPPQRFDGLTKVRVDGIPEDIWKSPIPVEFWFPENSGLQNLMVEQNIFAATWTFAGSPAFLISIPHEDKVDVITPFNIVVIGGGEF